MGAVTYFVRMVAKEGKAEEVQQLLLENPRRIEQGEPGNLAFGVGLMVMLMVITVGYLPIVLPTDHEASTRSDSDVEQLLQRAVAAAAISDEEAELILRTRIDDIDLNSLAEDLGIAYHTLNARRLRAEKRLLLFLGHVPVTFRGRKGPVCSARVIGAGLTGSAGRGAVTDLQRRR